MTNKHSELITFLKIAPPSHLDSIAVDKIKTWDESLTSIQVLEVLDMCVYGALASPIAMATIKQLYDDLLISENKTHDDNVPHAHWRKN
jgi:hypothetical protein